MRVLSYLVLPVIILVITAFAWVLFQSAENTRTVMVSDVALSPWDALTGAEITRAAAAVKARHGVDVIITRISLRQPEKAVALAWQQGQVPAREAEMTFRHAGQSFVTNFDLNANTLAPSTIIRGGQPMLSSTASQCGAASQL